MKTFFQKIGAFVLATLMLLATTSFSVRMHYCGTRLVSVSLNQPAKTCCKLSITTKKLSFKTPKKSCCHDTEFTKVAEDNLNKVEQVTFSSDSFTCNTPFTYNTQLETLSKSCKSVFSVYQPPSISFDRQVYYQVFLI